MEKLSKFCPIQKVPGSNPGGHDKNVIGLLCYHGENVLEKDHFWQDHKCFLKLSDSNIFQIFCLKVLFFLVLMKIWWKKVHFQGSLTKFLAAGHLWRHSPRSQYYCLGSSHVFYPKPAILSIKSLFSIIIS